MDVEIGIIPLKHRLVRVVSLIVSVGSFFKVPGPNSGIQNQLPPLLSVTVSVTPATSSGVAVNVNADVLDVNFPSLSVRLHW